MPSFSARTPAPSFLPYRLPPSSQVNSNSMSLRGPVFRTSSGVMFKTLAYLLA